MNSSVSGKDEIWVSARVPSRSARAIPTVKEEGNTLHTVKGWDDNCIGHTLLRNCLLKHVIEGKIEGRIEVMGRRGRRRKLLLDNLKERRGLGN